MTDRNLFVLTCSLDAADHANRDHVMKHGKWTASLVSRLRHQLVSHWPLARNCIGLISFQIALPSANRDLADLESFAQHRSKYALSRWNKPRNVNPRTGYVL
ncbi:hypothetical protein M404DRAFT_1002291 [Pisolithus tinctorius Marx 270]|uniref:Uncharacterized protein n=1 Tax=Pisolithus tinctorius Marx 270 TaxID=870435 RepID=A0A0C3P493_PISTI|nr:hypothetical protein M404DRAFT_1002291 [Pisolithus tinctorius Marx 270]